MTDKIESGREPQKCEDPGGQGQAGETNLVTLQGALERCIPGLVILDRDLELNGDHCADLVGVEGNGRLVMVLLVEGSGDEPVMAAIEALAFARRNATVLPVHLDAPRLRVDLDPRVILIAQSFDEHLMDRLHPLQQGSVELFEVRLLRSARGENIYLSAMDSTLGTSRPSVGEDISTEAFLAQLPPEQELIARECLEKLSRIDEELELRVRNVGAQWSFRGAELARLEWIDEALHASVAPDYTSRYLRSSAQVDLFVEEALVRHVRLIGSRLDAEAVHVQGGMGASTFGRMAEASQQQEEELEDDLSSLPDIPEGSYSSSRGDILTPEEIQAFQVD